MIKQSLDSIQNGIWTRAASSRRDNAVWDVSIILINLVVLNVGPQYASIQKGKFGTDLSTEWIFRISP